MCGIEMAVPATFERHKQADISGWLDVGLPYLQCISNGDAPVWHQAIDIVHGLWPLSMSMMTLCIPMTLAIWWHCFKDIYLTTFGKQFATLRPSWGHDSMCGIGMTVCLTYECHMQFYIS